MADMQMDRENAEMIAFLTQFIGPDANTIQVRARLDSLVELLIENDYVDRSSLDDDYVKRLHGYLSDIKEQVESQLRKAALQQGVSEAAGKLTVVKQ